MAPSIRCAVAASTALLAFSPPPAGALTLENAVLPQGPGCRQVVIGITTDAARVRPLVPRAFLFSRDAAGKAQLGFRVQTCDQLSIDGGPARRVTWSELGVRVLPPEGLPEVHVDPHVDGHDYYVLAFRTADRDLARHMRAAGVRPPHATKLLATQTWMDLERASSPLGGPAHDVVAGGALAAGERSAAGAITVSADLVGGMIARTTPVVHVHQWLVDRHCRLVRGEETKTRTLGGLAAYRLHAEPGTLLAQLAGSGDGPVDAQGSDTVVVGDVTATWSRAATPPEPAAPAAYDVLRPLSQGSPGGC